jgi:hypothetical protein
MNSMDISDDEPPTLVEVDDPEAAGVDDDLSISDAKVPITIVTGYLGAGSETPLN